MEGGSNSSSSSSMNDLDVILAPRSQSKEAVTAQEKHSPWSVLLWLYSGLMLVAFPTCALLGGIGERWTHPDPEELWHSRAAILVMLSAVTSEGLILASHRANMSVLGLPHHPRLRSKRQVDSLLALLSYTNKMLTALYIWHFQGGVVHVDTLALGGARPVYFVRFLQWSVAIPLLVLLGNRPCLDKMTLQQSLQRSFPSLVASFLYVWAAWLMEVTLSWIVRAAMLSLSLFGALFVSLDQMSLVASSRGDCLASYKAGIILYTIFTFAVFAAVFLLGRAGLVTSVWEQAFYAYADATIKVIQSSLLTIVRNRQDTELLNRWWVAARTASNDLKNLVEQAKAPVFALDTEGRIAKWNSSLQELSGLSLEAVAGKRLTEIVTDACRADVDAIVRRTLEEQAAPGSMVAKSSVNTKVPKQNMVEMSLGLNAKPIQLAMSFARWSRPTGELAGLMAIGQDLSTLAELRMVRERRSALMAMLSHELRSPLHGIMGLVGSLLESDAAKAFERQLMIIRGCSTRLLDLMTNAVDLAEHEKRTQKGYRLPRPTTPVDIAAIAEEVMVMVESGVTKMNQPLVRPSVRLLNDIEAGKVPLIPGDPHKLSQLLYNLLTNACKFTQRGSVTLSANYFPDRQRVEISVRDTGSGISPESQPRIFQAFEQEEDSSGGYQGLGLGLSLCSAIVELHGGDIQLQSERGSGSVFTVSLFADGSLGWPDPSSEPNIQHQHKSLGALPPLGEGFALGGLGGLGRAKEREAAAATAGSGGGGGGGEESCSGITSPKSQRISPSFFGSSGPSRNNEADIQSRQAVDLSFGKPLILSVDDDDVNQEVIVNGLADNYDVDCAMDGLQAVKYLESKLKSGERLPDAVLLDIQMPGMTGFEVCEEIRKRMGLSHIELPIIMVSARVPHELSSMEAYKKGATDYMSKPFDIQLLRHKIVVAVEVRRQSQSAAHAAAIAAEEAAEGLRAPELEMDVGLSLGSSSGQQEQLRQAEELKQEKFKAAQLAQELEELRVQLDSNQKHKDQLEEDLRQQQQKLRLQQEQQQELLKQQQQQTLRLQQQLKEMQGIHSSPGFSQQPSLPTKPLERKAQNPSPALQKLRFYPIIKAVSHQLVAACQLLGHCQQQLVSHEASGGRGSTFAAFPPGCETPLTEKTFSYSGERSSTRGTTKGASDPARSIAACTTFDVLPSQCTTVEVLDPWQHSDSLEANSNSININTGNGSKRQLSPLHLSRPNLPSYPEHDPETLTQKQQQQPQQQQQEQQQKQQTPLQHQPLQQHSFAEKAAHCEGNSTIRQQQIAPLPSGQPRIPPAGFTKQSPMPMMPTPMPSSRTSSLSLGLASYQQQHQQQRQHHHQASGSPESQQQAGNLMVDLSILQHILSKSRDIVLAEEENVRCLH